MSILDTLKATASTLQVVATPLPSIKKASATVEPLPAEVANIILSMEIDTLLPLATFDGIQRTSNSDEQYRKASQARTEILRALDATLKAQGMGTAEANGYTVAVRPTLDAPDDNHQRCVYVVRAAVKTDDGTETETENVA